MPALNSASPLPLYHQLADQLLARIRSGDYPVGSRIPSEPALARQYGIGRPTVRQATDRLVRRGILSRRRGSGTYVSEPSDAVDLFSLAGTLSAFERSGHAVKTNLVERTRRIDVGDDPDNPLAGRPAWHFSRLSRVGDEPVLLEDLYLDPEIFPDLDRYSLVGRSLSELVDQQYHRRPESAKQTFRVVRAGARRGPLLDVALREAILLVKRSIDFPDAPRSLFSEIACRTDRFAFSQTLGGLPDA